MDSKNIYNTLIKFASFGGKLFPFLITDIKENISLAVKNIFELISKTYGTFCIILFFVVLAGSGFLLLPIGLILIATQLVAENIDKVTLIGSLLCATGILYIIIAVLAIYLSFYIIKRIGKINAEDLLKK